MSRSTGTMLKKAKSLNKLHPAEGTSFVVKDCFIIIATVANIILFHPQIPFEAHPNTLAKANTVRTTIQSYPLIPYCRKGLNLGSGMHYFD